METPPPLLPHVLLRQGVWRELPGGGGAAGAGVLPGVAASIEDHRRKRARDQSLRVASSNRARGGGAAQCMEHGCNASVGVVGMTPSRLLSSICQHLRKRHGSDAPRQLVRARYGLPELRGTAAPGRKRQKAPAPFASDASAHRGAPPAGEPALPQHAAAVVVDLTCD